MIQEPNRQAEKTNSKAKVLLTLVWAGGLTYPVATEVKQCRWHPPQNNNDRV
jgi:hypothetical protein